MDIGIGGHRFKPSHYIPQRGGTTMLLPGVGFTVIDHNNPVKMIGHNHTFIQRNPRQPLRQFKPPFRHHPPGVIHLHYVTGNIAKQAFPPMDAHCHIIRTDRGIIIFPQADGMTMMDIRSKCHYVTVGAAPCGRPILTHPRANDNNPQPKALAGPKAV